MKQRNSIYFFYLFTFTLPPIIRSQTLSNVVATIPSPAVLHDSPFQKVTRSPYFVDKSHLIEHLQQEWTKTKFVHICRPRKFGKSVMLDMVKRFFEININTTTGQPVNDVTTTENYRLFKNATLNLNISQNKFFEKYFGEYVIIYLDFSAPSSPKSHKDVVQFVNRCLIDAYKPMAWVLKSSSCVDAKGQKIMDDIFNMNATADDISRSLKIFSKALANYFKKPVLVLVDEVDGPVDQALRLGLNSKKVNDELMTSLLWRALKQDDVHVHYALLMSTNCISGLFLTNDVKTSAFLDNEFSEYCSFTVEEMKSLFDRRGIISGDRREEAIRFYNGYKTSDLRSRFVNPCSIVKYLSQGNLSGMLSHWPANHTFPKLSECFANNELKIEFFKLILYQEIFFTRTKVFLSEDLEKLEKIFQGKGCPKSIDEDLKDLYLSYLFMNGYLTFFNCETIFHLANHETNLEFIKRYKNFYNDHFPAKQTSDVVKSLECIMESLVVPEDEIKKLETNLMTLFKIAFSNEDKIADDELQFHALLYTEIQYLGVFRKVSINRKNSNTLSHKQTHSKYERNDVTIIDESRSCILVVELKIPHDDEVTNDGKESEMQPADYWPSNENSTYLETMFLKVLVVNIHGENNTKIEVSQVFFPVQSEPIDLF